MEAGVIRGGDYIPAFVLCFLSFKHLFNFVVNTLGI
jgi:hypothetical protein